MANSINESAIKKLKLLFTVVDRNKGEFYLDVISQYAVNCQLLLPGLGTAASDIVELLGLNLHKAVVLSVVREDLVDTVLNTLEHKELLKGLFDDKQLPAVSDPQIQVYIGDETPIQSMKDCSVVTANYVLGDGLRGTIGIIGPKRMDYEKVVSTLRTLVSQLNDTFNQ